MNQEVLENSYRTSVLLWSNSTPTSSDILRNYFTLCCCVRSYLKCFCNQSFGCLFFSAHCQCQQGWREYETKCYFFSTDVKSWMEANAFCLEHNSNLMSIQDIHERVRPTSKHTHKKIYWMGLNDQVSEGVWEWSDGSPFIEYLFWMPNQPDNWQNEDCGHVVGSSYGQWNDENCNIKRKYICKHVNRKSAH
uniref:C-type lectin domain-containing protein n=1 Tax=Scophthalmus maximus TaxID=52904 RepID=A0A8D3BZN6_SCOMX